MQTPRPFARRSEPHDEEEPVMRPPPWGDTA